jgi:hypothetical protein
MLKTIALIGVGAAITFTPLPTISRTDQSAARAASAPAGHPNLAILHSFAVTGPGRRSDIQLFFVFALAEQVSMALTTLKGVLERAELRLRELRITARQAGLRAGKTNAIYNLRKAVRGTRRRVSVTDTTLRALASALECRPEWLMTGDEPMSVTGSRLGSIPNEEFQKLVQWTLMALGATDEAQAHHAARAVQRAFRTLPGPGEPPWSDDDRRRLVELAIRLVRQALSRRSNLPGFWWPGSRRG